MTLITQINDGIKEAMRNRNQLRLDTLRMLKSKILAADARGELPDSEVLKLFKTYHGNIKEAFEQAKTLNRPEVVEKLSGELAIVEEFLPKALSSEDTRKFVEQAIVDSGAKTKRDLGMVMRLIKLNNTIDGKMAKDLATELLPD